MKIRPIFHFKEYPIKLHLPICFMALAVSKYIELKTNISTQPFLSECKKITDVKILNKVTNKMKPALLKAIKELLGIFG